MASSAPNSRTSPVASLTKGPLKRGSTPRFCYLRLKPSAREKGPAAATLWRTIHRSAVDEQTSTNCGQDACDKLEDEERDFIPVWSVDGTDDQEGEKEKHDSEG